MIFFSIPLLLVYMCLYVRWISYRQHTFVFFNSLLQSVSLIAIFRPVTFEIIDIDHICCFFLFIALVLCSYSCLPLFFLHFVVLFEHFIWLRFLSFVAYQSYSFLTFFFSGYSRVCNIQLEQSQAHFQTKLYLFMGSTGTLWQCSQFLLLISLTLLSLILLTY